MWESAMFAPLLFTLLTFTDDKMIKVVNEQASLDLLELLQNQRMCRRSWLETASPLVALKANFLGRTFKLNYVHVHLSRLRVMRSVVIGKPGLDGPSCGIFRPSLSTKAIPGCLTYYQDGGVWMWRLKTTSGTKIFRLIWVSFETVFSDRET